MTSKSVDSATNRRFFSENFYYQNPEQLFNKISQFYKHGKGKVCLLTDFDRTLTVAKNQDEDFTTWQILKKHLPPQSQKEYDRLFSYYRPLEINSKLTLKMANKWWHESLNLYVKNKVNINEVKKDFLNKTSLRSDTKFMFDFCLKKDIPIIILSAGIKDIIEIWCKQYDIKPFLILSTKLIFSSNGIIKGWNKKTLIHVLNKKERGKKN